MSGQGGNNRGRVLEAACLLWVVVSVTGCYEPAMPPRVVDDHPSGPGGPAKQYRIAGWSVERRPIMLEVLGHGDDVTLILAGIHGNEEAGTALVRRLGDYLVGHAYPLEGKRILLLPVTNPDGKVRKVRHNDRGVDLNRNFPAANRVDGPESGRTALSEPETLAIYKVICEYRPDRIVSVHQPLGCVDYDGPAKDLADRMSGACGLPVKKLGARPGSLGSYSSQVRRIPIVTLELLDTDSGLGTEQLWGRYGRALLTAIE
jgi:murein peptide amidase A